jgi:hypothetical protein
MLSAGYLRDDKAEGNSPALKMDSTRTIGDPSSELSAVFAAETSEPMTCGRSLLLWRRHPTF